MSISAQFSVDPLQPRNVFSLNGTWYIAGGTENEIPQHFKSIVPVPAVVDMAEPAYDWQKFDFHWYYTSFTLTNFSQKHFAFLKIAQSMFGTDVWLNGHHLGGSISCYTSHEYPLNEFLHEVTPNELIVRVGAKHTLPPESAVGRDQEKEIYTPGIWGDVSLICVGGARVKLVQVIPHIDSSTAEMRVRVENLEFRRRSFLLSARIVEKRSRKSVSAIHDTLVAIDDHQTEQVTLHIPIDHCRLWSQEDPFLYEVELQIEEGKHQLDRIFTIFGMREFKIVDNEFYLNGLRILLRGGNIAFHRFLSDPERKLLPWNKEWIKRLLIDIPKEHNFNFFRNHLGQMYNAWYDIADEHGMLLQNEWQFWGTTGSTAQIRKEFTEWLQDNWNHPSIVIWDPLNESRDDTVQYEIVPEMKTLDPTRPWESVDFLEEHPYIYSLGMVLNDRKFGFTRSLTEIENDSRPTMLNEFNWWWLDKENNPSLLTKDVVERWMGREYTTEDLINHQSFLAQELIELFRRMRIKAIQPFVYLSNSDGPTAHWFLGNVKDLHPKPLLTTLKNVFSPFGVSIELWDRHFFVGETRSIRIFIFNDSNSVRRGVLVFGVKSPDGTWVSRTDTAVEVEPVSDSILSLEITLPAEPGSWNVCAELQENFKPIAHSLKIVHIFSPVIYRLSAHMSPVVVFDPSQEIMRYLSQLSVPISDFHKGIPHGTTTILLNGNVLSHRAYSPQRKAVAQFVRNGGTLILVEPEYRIVGNATNTIVAGIDLIVTQRADVDKGGYDSYVFAEDRSHQLWKNIDKEHLKMFNGALGGEIVSQYDVEFSVPSKRLASCGMQLTVVAAAEVEVGKGKIILSRIQLRDRLLPSPSSYRQLFARRPDPVAQQYLLNLISL